MSDKGRGITLIATANWAEPPSPSGYRFLLLESGRFLRRNTSGGWRIRKGDKLMFKVQIVDMEPEGSSRQIGDLRPVLLSVMFCPSLRWASGSKPPVTPFRKKIDFRLRQGLSNFRKDSEPPPELNPSRLFTVLREAPRHRHRPFWAKFEQDGSFDFSISLSVGLFDDGQPSELRRYRTDPEMDVDHGPGSLAGDGEAKPRRTAAKRKKAKKKRA